MAVTSIVLQDVYVHVEYAWCTLAFAVALQLYDICTAAVKAFLRRTAAYIRAYVLHCYP
jgi:hypothetical protein